jgi:hypothetical protein
LVFKNEGEDEKFSRSKKDHSPTDTTRDGVVVMNLQVGDCWLWSLIIFMIQMFVSVVLGPHSIMGGCGGAYHPTTVANGVRGVVTIFVAPPGVGFRGSSPEANF